MHLRFFVGFWRKSGNSGKISESCRTEGIPCTQAPDVRFTLTAKMASLVPFRHIFVKLYSGYRVVVGVNVTS